ncbi:MAG: hypothetical protein QOF76_4718 [Solirubrobacteraceae bacterium]|jgi:hypothetical protein|nr:hypothetical protein [Solirubrobacteraceae bacterium]
MMRILALTLAVSAALAAPAAAAKPKARSVTEHSLPGVVADPSSGYAAYRTSLTELALRHTTGPADTFAITSGCVPTAVTVGAVGLTCVEEGDVDAAYILATGKATITPVAVKGTGQTRVVAIGRRWVEVAVSSGETNRIVIVDRVSNAEIDLAKDPFGPRNALDLDLVTPVQRICAGHRRSAGDATLKYEPATMFDGVFVEGPKVTVCNGATKRYPSPLAADGRFVAYGGSGTVVLTNVRNPHKWRYSADGAPVLSATGLWLQKAGGALRVVALPKAD